MANKLVDKQEQTTAENLGLTSVTLSLLTAAYCPQPHDNTRFISHGSAKSDPSP